MGYNVGCPVKRQLPASAPTKPRGRRRFHGTVPCAKRSAQPGAKPPRRESRAQISFLINDLTDTGLRGPQRRFLQSVSPASESLLQANARAWWASAISAAPRCLSDPFLPVAATLDPLRRLEVSILGEIKHRYTVGLTLRV